MSKKPENKYRPSLVYTSCLVAMAKVREYGIKKHGSSEDWRTTEPIQHFDAAIRHIRAHLDGEAFDEGSGEPHLAHAMTNLMFEIERFNGVTTSTTSTTVHIYDAITSQRLEEAMEDAGTIVREDPSDSRGK